MDHSAAGAGALRRCNILWCTLATLLASAGALPQAAVGQMQGAAAQEVVDTAPPDPLATMAAFQAVDRWVRAWSASSDIELPVARAASVILRLDGEIVGRGIDVAHRPEGDANVTVLATKAALQEAEARLPIARDALFQDALREVARRITVSVELAGPLVPWTPREWGHASLEIEPGVEGVAVRMGDRTLAMFPIAMMVTRMEAGAAYPALVARLGDDPGLGLKSPAEIARETGAVFYRFRTSHLAQPRAGAPPEFLHRGGKVFEQRRLDGAELRRWAGALAAHLEGGASGAAYDPVRGEMGEASDAGIALAALALVQYSELQAVQTDEFVRVRRAAAGMLARLSPEMPPSACAVAMVALRGISVEGSIAALANISDDGDRLRALFESAVACLDRADGLPMAERALITWARARRAVERAERSPELEAEIRSLYRAAGPGELVALMPWLGWTELTWSRFEQEPGEGSKIPATTALRDMRDLIWHHQVRGFELGDEQQDLAGAIVFTRGARAMPTWQVARPVAFLATMLGDERLTSEDEVSAELSRLLAALRFLRQLTAGEAEAHMYRHPDRATGGVRASLWDQRMPPEATALTLLAVCETIRSLERIEARRAAQQEASGAPQP